MCTTAAEKYEIIRLVKEAALPPKQVLAELDIEFLGFLALNDYIPAFGMTH